MDGILGFQMPYFVYSSYFATAPFWAAVLWIFYGLFLKKPPKLILLPYIFLEWVIQFL